MKWLARHAEQIRPGILAFEVSIASHHARERAEREAIAGETGGDELALGMLADVRQAIVGFDDLAEPAILDGPFRQQAKRRCSSRANNFSASSSCAVLTSSPPKIAYWSFWRESTRR